MAASASAFALAERSILLDLSAHGKARCRSRGYKKAKALASFFSPNSIR